MTYNCILFLVIKWKVLKKFKISKKNSNGKKNGKNANLSGLENFDVMGKMNSGFGISDPKLIKFD